MFVFSMQAYAIPFMYMFLYIYIYIILYNIYLHMLLKQSPSKDMEQGISAVAGRSTSISIVQAKPSEQESPKLHMQCTELRN